MTPIGMDTHEVVKELLAAGFTEGQAEAVTRLVYRAQDIDLSSLATKADLAATKTELQADLAATKTELQAGLAATKTELHAGLQVSLAETKAEILKWMVGTIGVQTVVILGAVVTIARLLPR